MHPTLYSGSLAAYLAAPDEVLSKIIFHTVYTADGCIGGDTEVADVDWNGDSSSFLHALLARNILLTSKEFYRLGVEVLWYNVVVRSHASLATVARLCTRGGRFTTPAMLGGKTRRFELRLCVGYDPSLATSILAHMPNLKIFLLHSYCSPIEEIIPRVPSAILDALTESCVEIRRIQLDSSVESPTPSDVIRLLDKKPQLEVLSVLNFNPEMVASRPSPSLLTPTLRPRHLRMLTIGFARWTPDATPPNITALDRFVGALVDNKCLPQLTQLELFDYTPNMRRFLLLYGVQLRGLLFVVPDRDDPSMVGPNFLDMCPYLETLAWIITSWGYLNPCQSLPNAHFHLQTLTLGLCQSADKEPSQYRAHLQGLLDKVRMGNYPTLRNVFIRPRGHRLPAIDGTPWFERLKLEWYRRGLHLRVVE